MLYATNRFPGDGMTTQYEISFVGGYLDRAHVKAYVEGANLVQTPVTLSPGNFLGQYTIGGLAPVPVGSTIVIYRDTPKAPLVDFVNGSRFTEANLDTATRQGSFIAAEGADAVSPTGIAGALQLIQDAAGVASTAAFEAGAFSHDAALSRDSASASAASARINRDITYENAVLASGSKDQAAANAVLATNARDSAYTNAVQAAGSATTASNAQADVSLSASNAAASAAAAASTAQQVADNTASALDSKNAAAASALSAATSATQSANSATAAGTAKTAAETARDSAISSATNAGTSASTASTQAGIATTKAGVATTKASEASASAASAAASAASIKPLWAGNVAASGTADKIPAGWAVAKDSTGIYLVSTDLPLPANNYAISATCRDPAPGLARRTLANGTGFYVETVDGAGVPTDRAFSFIAILI